MPSSSTRETTEEIRLRVHFRDIYACLLFAESKKEADSVLEIFATTLDFDSTRLYNWLVSDEEYWKIARKTCDNKKDSELCWMAGDSMFDAGTCLFEHDRKIEGAQHCEWAQELYNLALEYQDVEKHGI